MITCFTLLSCLTLCMQWWYYCLRMHKTGEIGWGGGREGMITHIAFFCEQYSYLLLCCISHCYLILACFNIYIMYIPVKNLIFRFWPINRTQCRKCVDPGKKVQNGWNWYPKKIWRQQVISFTLWDEIISLNITDGWMLTKYLDI